MEALSRWFERLIFNGSGPAAAGPVVITLVGSGGKTSLIWFLARHFSQSRGLLKILVSPSTKMFPPLRPEHALHCYYDGAPPVPAMGITLAGMLNKKTGKLEALPPAELQQTAGAYDLVFIEGDGSRGLPLKGWADHEPVVPPFTTFTVGMLPLWPLGKPVNREIAHRLPLFRTLTGADEGEALGLDHFAALISGNTKNAEHSTVRSLFTAARGKKLLFFNQIEDEAAFSGAYRLVLSLPPEFRFGLHKIIAGSVQRDTVREIHGLLAPSSYDELY